MGRVLFLALVTFATVGIMEGKSILDTDPNTKIKWKDFFCSTWFHWPWLKNSNLMSFSTERIPQKRTFVQGCEVDVGTCPVGSCFKCPDSGHICPKTETRTHTCPESGTWNYEYVTECVCCKDHGITVNVRVIDAETKAGIEGIIIQFGGKLVGYSDANGQLSSVISSDLRKLVISATDSTNYDYLPAVRMYDVIEGLQTSMEVEIAMARQTFSIEFDSTKSKTICLAENQDCLESNDGTPKLEIKPKSFRKSNRQLYRGLVKASISILDFSTENSNEITPGHFESLNSNIVDTIVPRLTFAIDFRDDNNKKLRIVKNVLIYTNSDNIWTIDLSTGFWKEAKKTSITTRRKRQTSDQMQYSFTLQSGTWMTLGQIPSLPKCYIKARAFVQSSSAEISDSSTIFYQAEIIAADSNNEKIRYYFAPTQTLAGSCFEVNCLSDSTLTGIMQLKAIENVENTDGSSTSAITYLIPKPLNNYVSSIQTNLQTVQYSPTTDPPEMNATFVSSPDGPFYDNIDTCEQSDVSQPAFHFIKPDQQASLSSSTTNASLCTARIGFNDPGGLFFKYLSSLATLPTIQAVSVWTNGNDRYYFTDFSQMSFSTSENFYFACVKYRCAPPADDTYDESIGDTALYLDLLLPETVEIDVNDNGALEQKSVDCKTGNCAGPFCLSQIQYKPDKNNIDASLWVDRGNNVPGKFFLPESNPLGTDSCSASTLTTAYAHTISCHFDDPQK